MSNSGTVKNFNPAKGFGFIIGADGTDIFLHIKGCVDGGVPKIGDTLTYDLEESKIKPGQMQASNVSGGTGTAVKPGQPGTGAMWGQCKNFSEKGFGFIIGQDGTDVFLHIKAMVDGTTPQAGDNLQYDLEESKVKPGQMQATNVTGGTGWGAGKGGGKDAGKGWGGKDAWGGGKGGPYGGGKDAWGGKGGGKDSWGGGGWGGDAGWGGKGGGKWGGDAGWGGKGGW